jgi:iron complex outermembrane recepter protein
MSKVRWMLSAGAFAFAAPALAQPTQDTTPQQPSPTEQGAVTPESQRSADDTQDEGTIIVTAQGRAQALQDVPLAVSAVSQEQLQNSGITDIRALNQLAPSLLISSTGSEANGSARIRGIGTVGDNPGLESSVAVFVDGVYRSRSGIGLNELGEVDRIEVLRGPQGTLFGRNTSAGLIHIITRKPDFTFGGMAELSYGNYGAIRGQAAITGPIGDSLAFRIDGVYFQRDGFYDVVNASGGTEDNVNDRNRYLVRGQLLFRPNDALSIRLIGDYTHRDESCCGAVYISTRQANDPTPGVPGDFTVSPTNNPIVDILTSLGGILPSAGNPFNRQLAITPGRTYRNETEDYGVSAEVDWDLGSVNLTSITAYRRYRAGGAADIDYGNVDIAYRADDGNAYREFKTLSQELRLNGSAFNGRLDWLIGGYYAHEDLTVVDNAKFGTQYGAFASCRLVSNISPSAVLRNPAAPGCLSPTGRATVAGAFGAAAPAILAGLDRLSTINNLGSVRDVYSQTSENFAIFTHNIINITDQLHLTLGARYTQETKDFSAVFNNNNAVCPVQQANLSPLLANTGLRAFVGGILTLSCTGNSSTQINGLNLADTRDEDEVTGTAILSWNPTRELLVYASYSRGYKAGGFNLDRSALGTIPVGNNPTFAPITNADVTDLEFEPEIVNAFEIGFKLTKRNFTLNVAAFNQEFQDFQLNTFNGSVFIVQNINSCSSALTGGTDTDAVPNQFALGGGGTCTGDSKPGVRTRGVEIEATLRPMPYLNVALGYTYAQTEYRRNLTGSFGQALDPALFLLSGDNLSNAPEHVATASLAWTPPIGNSGITGLFYVDGRLTSDYNTGSDLAPEKEQDGYFLANARIGIRGPDQRWALEVWAQNLFNEQYTQVGFNTPFQGAGSQANVAAFGGTATQIYSAFLAEPRTYGITGRVRF